MDQLIVKGQLIADVVYGDQRKSLPLLIIAGKGPSLFGRDWLLQLRLDWQGLYSLRAPASTTMQAILNKHAAVFTEELGCVKGIKAKIYIDPEARPRFCKPRSVPFALRGKVEKEEVLKLQHQVRVLRKSLKNEQALSQEMYTTQLQRERGNYNDFRKQESSNRFSSLTGLHRLSRY